MIYDEAEDYLQRAWDFERGARWIIERFEDDRVRYAPPLHLIAHGFELLFKAELILAGVAEKRRKNEFGHDLEKMWDSAELADLRAASGPAAEAAVAKAKKNPRFQGQTFHPDPPRDFEEQIRYLGKLHSAELVLCAPVSQLDAPTLVNVPPFMDDLLEALIEDCLRRSGRKTRLGGRARRFCRVDALASRA